MWVSMRAVAITLVSLAMLAVPGCDNNGSSGGATTASAGYTTADLAGKWTGSMGCMPNPCNFIFKFDANGNIIYFSWVPAIQGATMKGSVSVDAAGNLSGITYTMGSGAKVEKVDWGKIAFVSAGKLSGTWLYLELNSPNPTWDPFWMVMKKQ